MDYPEPEHYLAHRPPMMLIDRVVEIADDSVICETQADVSLGKLARFAEDGQIPAEVLLELMAQAVGCWAGEKSHVENAAEVGFLLSVRAADFARPQVPCGLLRMEMHREMAGGKLAGFEGGVTLAGEKLASARIAVYQPEKAELSELFRRPLNG